MTNDREAPPTSGPVSGELVRHLLGFDIRIGKPGEACPWADEQKEMFLLKLDVARVLSVDQMVWPSVFGPDGLGRPDYVGFFAPFWECLEEMVAVAQTLGDAALQSSLVGTGLRLDLCDQEERLTWRRFLRGISPSGEVGRALAEAQPRIPSEDWRLLGYDVGDFSGLSGLSNCGFISLEDDQLEMRRQWGPLLNIHHLFADPIAAREFKLVSDRRVREHAPFSVYELWEIPWCCVRKRTS